MGPALTQCSQRTPLNHIAGAFPPEWCLPPQRNKRRSPYQNGPWTKNDGRAADEPRPLWARRPILSHQNQSHQKNLKDTSYAFMRPTAHGVEQRVLTLLIVEEICIILEQPVILVKFYPTMDCRLTCATNPEQSKEKAQILDHRPLHSHQNWKTFTKAHERG